MVNARTPDGWSARLWLIAVYVLYRDLPVYDGNMCPRLLCLLMLRNVAIKYVFRAVFTLFIISMGGSPPNSYDCEKKTGPSFIPASTYCRQESSTLVLSSVYLRYLDLTRTATGEVISWLLMTDSAIWAILTGEYQTFLTPCSINDRTATDRRLFTILRCVMTVSSTSLVITSVTWKRMPVAPLCTRVWSLVRVATGLCSNFAGCSLESAASEMMLNVSSCSVSMFSSLSVILLVLKHDIHCGWIVRYLYLFGGLDVGDIPSFQFRTWYRNVGYSCSCG